MKVKIDTKEKFHVIDMEETDISANMTEEVKELLLSYLNHEIKNVVVKFSAVRSIDKEAATGLLKVQEIFYDNNCSLVFCEFQPAVIKYLDEIELLEIMNFTPTESEAWDIVQMEIIERELLDDAPNH